MVIVLYPFLVFVVPKPFGSCEKPCSQVELKTTERDYRRSNPARLALFGTPESSGGSEEEAGPHKAVFEVMANLAGDAEATPSMMDDVEVDDDVPMEHVPKPINVGIDGADWKSEQN